ncbi:Queuosine biosynthesis protein QueE [Granulibacter bethesdensis]|uniref:7-carboxy-7-deazaguanine synthase n=2 Tax=Granulibacter bethesdensis TaxID=364410 RepID=Q0BPP9_GRABC|nr:Queuosine biosynthesis protein QueE [Granulibacter bethesdensis CGDNIH1]AHJ67824.1 Queuosine biosynthesis protein QueE [Granulibacter bethesdensis]APH53081.1 Queuosine biosynthesis protein QueE [Granulibacter bethesdensis]APH65770.1 Queuosine biosynthesis protein QueE [Granulibacter bethesdensis]
MCGAVMTQPTRNYTVKEIFLTLQGEGIHAGRPAVFCRFAGCNLWSGREEDRQMAGCTFCDTDFIGMDGENGGRYPDAASLARAIAACWQGGAEHRFVVLTGGEPLLQVDAALIDALHEAHFQIAVETNGTQPAPAGLDWICVSPKADNPLVLTGGDELKLVFPQPDAPPERFEALNFRHFLLQPLDDSRRADHTRAAIEYCLHHPRWRLSVQTHKTLGIP